MIFNQIAGGGESVKEPYIQWSVVDGAMVNDSARKIDLRNTNVSTIKPYQLYSLYRNNTAVSGEFDFGALMQIEESGMERFLDGCVNIQSVNCGDIVSVKTKGLKWALVRTGINEVSFDNLYTVEPFALQEICSGCGSLSIVKFPVLSMVFNDSLGVYQYSGANNALTGAFGGSSVSEIYFDNLPVPASTDTPSDVNGCFGSNTMLLGCSNVTIHFPKRLEQYVNTNIASLPNFSNGFGGTNITILFDRITKITRDNSTEYNVAQKTGDYWIWQQVGNPYNQVYTSPNPSVGDNVYGNSILTGVVGTIIAVA